MHQNCNERGALLLEVLIAASVLAIGILACLNIFSASLGASQKTADFGSMEQLLDQAFFERFLDPAGVDLETGTFPVESSEKLPFSAQLRVKSMREDENTENKEKAGKTAGNQPKPPTPKPQQPVRQEFFDVTFVAERNKDQKPVSKFHAFLFRYGQSKKRVSQ